MKHNQERTKMLFRIIVVFLLAPYISFAGDFIIAAENDIFFHTDQHYTHGTRLSYAFDGAPLWTDKIIDGDKKWNVILGQYMYTPNDITIEELVENERPYGGWLYLGNSLSVRNGNKLDYFEVDLGVTGNASLAEDTQKLIHKWTGSSYPEGWKNQIKTEPGINLIYQKKYKYGNKYIDIIPQYGGCAGNIYSYANVGGTIRAGYNLPDDFSFYKIEPHTREFDNSVFSICVFLGAEERFVLRNIFLDGNTFRDSYSVEKENFVSDFMLGIEICYENDSIVIADNYRTREFEDQDEDDRFSTIMINIGF
ncbi:MAG TPA: lipid A deacylase LpxR family protein [Candidatus Paceibacterota bacterium]|nr:lipid A deacylase LpxR family protein [Candidatus Paceibacterota bacterium]